MSENLKGALFMTAAMAGFAVEDAFLKFAARSLPVGEILLVFGGLGLLGFVALARLRGEPLLPRAILSRPMLARAGAEGAGRLFYTLAIALTPLASASAILQATPLVVVAGAALFLRERVGWRRWTAVAVGFLGVLVILRPGLSAFTPLSLLAVLGMLGFAFRDLATRAAPPEITLAQLGIAGFAAILPAGALLLALSGGATVPDVPAALALIAASAIGVAAYAGLTIAMRTGEIAAVAPFRYTRLVFAFLLAILLFAERPDAATLMGSALIVATGLFALWRSARKQA